MGSCLSTKFKTKIAKNNVQVGKEETDQIKKYEIKVIKSKKFFYR